MRMRGKRLWLYLIYAMLALSLVGTVTLSRYTSSVTGTGTARAARFVSALSPLTVDPAALPQTPGETGTFSFSVTNAGDGQISEVTQAYSLTLTTTGNLPLTFTLAPTAGVPSGQGTQLAGGSVTPGTALTGGQFPHSVDCTHTYQLTITWPKGQADEGYAGEIDLVTLTVDVEQVLPAAA